MQVRSDGDISEDSDLRGKDFYDSSYKKSSAKQKLDRIRENIEDDYENDGFESYAQSL